MFGERQQTLENIAPQTPILIAGPTASGKSKLALALAEAQGGVIVNADASQVYACWQVLTARPGPKDLSRAPHALYGHLAYDVPYSAGHWLRELEPLLAAKERVIIVGGTGLYFTALTEGLADIPATPPEIRQRGDALPLSTLCAELDSETKAKIDLQNRARVQRAWEVLQTTGQGLAVLQAQTAPPLLPAHRVAKIALYATPDWLNARIYQRFEMMAQSGALEEAEAMRSRFDPGLQSCKAIGAPELMAHLRGEISLTQAKEAACIATRQYAKRQRTWMRARMKDWHWLDAERLHTDFTK